jgi:hypothetical protein
MAKKLVQLPYIYDNKKAEKIEALADEVYKALQQSSRAFGAPQQRLKGRDAAQASACVVAALQCAGWLVQSTSCFSFMRHEGMSAHAYQAAYEALHMRTGRILGLATKCTQAATTWLPLLDPGQTGGVDLLRRVTCPPDNVHVPGEAAIGMGHRRHNH